MEFNKKIIALINNKALQYVFLSLSLLVAVYPIILSFIYEPIFCDGAYYLSIVNRISDGYIPYKTVALGYTPLWFYMMAALKYIFFLPDVCYEFYLFVHYCFVFGCAFCIYGISRQLNVSKCLSYLTSWLFLMLSHWLQGNVVLLEIPSIFWGLLTLYLILKNQDKELSSSKFILLYITIGVLCCFSFLTKQYGLGFLFLSAYLFIVSKKEVGRKLLYFFVGFTIPLCISFLYFGFDFINVFANGYGTTVPSIANFDTSLSARLKLIAFKIGVYFWRICPPLILLIFSIPLACRQRNCKYMIFLLLGFVGFSFQFYFLSDALHYMLYILPFALVLISYQMSFFKSKYLKVINFGLYSLVVLFSLYSVYYNRVLGHYYWNPNDKLNHSEVARKVMKYADDSSTIWTYDATLIYLYYYTNLLPPRLAEYGYSFGPLVSTPKRVMSQINSSDYVLILENDHENIYFITDEIMEELNKHESVYVADNVKMINMNKLISH